MLSMTTPQRIFLMMLMTVTSVQGTQVEWANNPDLVAHSNPHQRSQHIKLMVLMVGETAKLECNVLLATQPVNDIQWRLDGADIRDHEKQIVETNQDGVFLVSYFVISNITEEMHDSTVTCEYAKERYSERVEAILHVVKLEIETTEEVCQSCTGDVKLVFKEAKSSPSEPTVDKKTISKIAKMTNVEAEDIISDNSGFSFILPLAACMDNPAIWAMKPKVLVNGTVSTLEQCECASAGTNLGMWLFIGSIILIAAVVVVLQFVKTGIKSLVASVISGSIGLLLLILACAWPQFTNWYPGTVLWFYLLSPVPIMIAKRHSDSSNNTCIALAWFFTAGIAVSAFALPIVLARVPVEVATTAVRSNDHIAKDQVIFTTTLIESDSCVIVLLANAVMFVTILKLMVTFYSKDVKGSVNDCPESMAMNPNVSEREEDSQKNPNINQNNYDTVFKSAADC